MKKVILIFAIVLIATSCKVDSKNKVETSDAEEVKTTVESISYSVDTENSSVTWKGFKPTGSHNGAISISEGTINVLENELVGGKFTIDMNTIVDLDMAVDNEYNAKLVGHLNSADFFDVEKFPTAMFEITKVVKTDSILNVSGNLTLKEITKNITIPVTLTNADGTITLTSELFKIDRTEFGIEFKSMKLAGMVKDKSIDDLFEMSFVVSAKK